MTTEQKIAQAIAAARPLPGASIELCGLWVWVDFPAKPADEVRTTLKDNGFRWAPKKKRWYFPGVPARSKRRMPMEQIRQRHGSVTIAAASDDD